MSYLNKLLPMVHKSIPLTEKNIESIYNFFQFPVTKPKNYQLHLNIHNDVEDTIEKLISDSRIEQEIINISLDKKDGMFIIDITKKEFYSVLAKKKNY